MIPFNGPYLLSLKQKMSNIIKIVSDIIPIYPVKGLLLI